MYSRLSTLQEGLIPKKRAGADDDLHRINELIQVTLPKISVAIPLLYRPSVCVRIYLDFLPGCVAEYVQIGLLYILKTLCAYVLRVICNVVSWLWTRWRRPETPWWKCWTTKTKCWSCSTKTEPLRSRPSWNVKRGHEHLLCERGIGAAPTLVLLMIACIQSRAALPREWTPMWQRASGDRKVPLEQVLIQDRHTDWAGWSTPVYFVFIFWPVLLTEWLPRLLIQCNLAHSLSPIFGK